LQNILNYKVCITHVAGIKSHFHQSSNSSAETPNVSLRPFQRYQNIKGEMKIIKGEKMLTGKGQKLDRDRMQKH
jgi:hypothetical protein